MKAPAIDAVTVRHRLALGIECVDALTRRPVGVPVRIAREGIPERFVPDPDPRNSSLDFVAHGYGRAVLTHGPRLPSTVLVRIADPSRRYLPRRFAVPLRTLAELDGAAIPPGSRRLRPWLLPGIGYGLDGATALTGRVVRGGVPVPAVRVTAFGVGDRLAGWAHGDDRGEFVLVVQTTGEEPITPSVSFPVTLRVAVPGDPATALPAPVEPVSRAELPGDDSDLMRGLRVPDGYLTSSQPVRAQAWLARPTRLPTDIEFVP